MINIIDLKHADQIQHELIAIRGMVIVTNLKTDY